MSLRKVLASAVVLATIAVGAFTQVASAGTSKNAAGSITSAASGYWSCLDNRNGVWAAGNPIQIWRCGAAGGVDQNFRVARFHGATVLEAVAPAGKPRGPWCVTASKKGAPLTIRHCTGKGAQVVIFRNSLTIIPAVVIPTKVGLFTKVGLAMDLTGDRTANGTKVQGWPLNKRINQQWVLP